MKTCPKCKSPIRGEHITEAFADEYWDEYECGTEVYPSSDRVCISKACNTIRRLRLEVRRANRTKVVWKAIPKTVFYVGVNDVCNPNDNMPYKERLFLRRADAEDWLRPIAKTAYDFFIDEIDERYKKEWMERGFKETKTAKNTRWRVPWKHEYDRVGGTFCEVVQVEVHLKGHGNR